MVKLIKKNTVSDGSIFITLIRQSCSSVFVKAQT